MKKIAFINAEPSSGCFRASTTEALNLLTLTKKPTFRAQRLGRQDLTIIWADEGAPTARSDQKWSDQLADDSPFQQTSQKRSRKKKTDESRRRRKMRRKRKVTSISSRFDSPFYRDEAKGKFSSKENAKVRGKNARKQKQQ